MLLYEAGRSLDSVTATQLSGVPARRTSPPRIAVAATITADNVVLRALGIRVTVGPADDFTLPRLIQLELRTNQFNMTGRSHGEARTRQFAASADHGVLSVEVADRFGTEGVVGGVRLDRGAASWVVRNLVLSCRVLSRGVRTGRPAVRRRPRPRGVGRTAGGPLQADRTQRARGEALSVRGFRPAGRRRRGQRDEPLRDPTRRTPGPDPRLDHPCRQGGGGPCLMC